MWWCWLVVSCKAGSRSQGSHGNSPLWRIFKGPLPTFDGISSQTHQLTMSLTTVNDNKIGYILKYFGTSMSKASQITKLVPKKVILPPMHTIYPTDWQTDRKKWYHLEGQIKISSPHFIAIELYVHQRSQTLRQFSSIFALKKVLFLRNFLLRSCSYIHKL